VGRGTVSKRHCSVFFIYIYIYIYYYILICGDLKMGYNKSNLKYSLIQAYIAFQSHLVTFVDMHFLHYQLIGLIVEKLLVLAWSWLH
jgi:hypothetical protein